MKTSFRKEVKYEITTGEFLQLKSSLGVLLTPDKNTYGEVYKIRSLYFDSLYNKDYFDNINGLLEKRKIRLRIYPPNYNNVVLEWKCKEGSDGIKHKLWITRKEGEELIKGDFDFLGNKVDSISQQLYSTLISGVYRPKTIVEYERQAFTYEVSNVRITFDSNIKGTLTGNGFFEKEPMLVPILDYGHGILEIKYMDFLPGPIKRLTGKLDRISIANSKYVISRNLM